MKYYSINYTLTLLFAMLLIGCTTEDIVENTDGQGDENPNSPTNEDCTGLTENSVNENYNFRLIDTDFLSGNRIREGGDNDFSKKFIHDNGIFVCTGTFDETNFDTNGNLALYAVDEAFEPIWTFPEEPGEFFDVIRASDGNYVAVGRKGNGNDSKIYIVKVSSMGELIWQHTVTNDNENATGYATTIIENPTGGYVVLGLALTTANPFGFGDGAFAFLLSENLTIEWSTSLNTNTRPSDIISNSKGNYIFTYNASSDIVIGELSAEGELLNQKSYGSSDLDGANHLLQLRDNTYLVTGYTLGADGDVSENYGNTDIWVLKLDSELNLLNEQAFGGFGFQRGVFTAEMDDGTLLLTAQGTGNIFVLRSRKSAIFLRITPELCIIDWDDDLQSDEYTLTDAIWLNDRREIVTFANENDRGNSFDTTDDFYHQLLRHKVADE